MLFLFKLETSTEKRALFSVASVIPWSILIFVKVLKDNYGCLLKFVNRMMHPTVKE
ncbi:MAG: hypothetical protein ACI8WT_003332 [Clostridium sp.]|jgi:hypothetical protein